MSAQLEILVIEGPLKGRRFSVPADGLRLGRSSSCEISIPDPALSRNHCLFETRDGGLWVTDLASANGTIVNDVQLGPDSQCLQPGDVVIVGDSALQAVAAASSVPPPVDAPAADPALPVIDLGLGDKPSPDGTQDAARSDGGAKSSWLRFVLWGVALVSVLLMLMTVFGGKAFERIGLQFRQLLAPMSAETDSPVKEMAADDIGDLVSFAYEKVEAGPRSIYRYAVTYDDSSKSLGVRVDDVPSGRRVKESAELSADARARLADVFSSPDLYRLAPEYAGNPSEPGAVKGFSLHMVRSGRVLDVSVENAPEPQAFQEMRMKLEAFADSELGLFAIHMPVERLRELSAEACRVADAKWAERDSRFGNLAEALRKYDEALNYLKTVDPKPADYESIRERRKRVKDRLDNDFREHRVNAEQAIGTQNWEQAKYELQILLELVDDQGDARNKEASRKLLEVESRMKAKR